MKDINKAWIILIILILITLIQQFVYTTCNAVLLGLYLLLGIGFGWYCAKGKKEKNEHEL